MTLRAHAVMSLHRCKNAQHGSKTGMLPPGGFSLVPRATGKSSTDIPTPLGLRQPGLGAREWPAWR